MDEGIRVEEVAKASTKTKKCDLFGPLCSIHNQARILSIFLFLACIGFEVCVWSYYMSLDQVQFLCLNVSTFCTFVLLFGTINTIRALYSPAVYIMRFSMIQMIFYNLVLIVLACQNIDTFVPDTTLRDKKSTIIYLNKNFGILSRCLKLGVQIWVFLLAFGCLQFITKDYYYLRNKKRESINLNWPIGCLGTPCIFKRNKKSPKSIDQQYQLEGTVVVAKNPVSPTESICANENHHGLHETIPDCCASEIKKSDIGCVELMKL